ncbi:bifunctional lysylphosphatidylglycerol flippase/synthetase MprF [Clostridium perfringens]|uniref:bifunctional lysylphosphatidylglycerol flippase/synthetase MprF n=1 Tax=Clostridium perfringens TaxID=1502 RepID=UPI001A241819|nr:bifunctional lysylphosphatidylglycerol flippase/synthetase MprF [Clostridium perfringens]MDM0645461.1 bifunctional lysylphosphatidylglycerol flippase/synthetase MprF [Clostridium perfringens]MDM0648472.1 bifunctional lysylphosphatidylglycerol flippase/synthetase MprF [Clostridium perfringens]HAT4250251.1 bifunctional lysylphosphatidylglycerol flippase/synthetase MprF [Clostridium perfringens]
MKSNKNLKLFFKIAFVSVVILFIVKEFTSVFRNFNTEYFFMYRNKLDFLNLLIIAVLGIISYIPLSFYDFILKKKVGIRLKNSKLYKYSWIASSIASLLGFGGATSLAFKQYFYGDYVDDKKKLLKEIGKIVALNLTGLSIVCCTYMGIQIYSWNSLGVIKYAIAIIALYAPGFIIYSAYKYFKTKDRLEFFSTLGTIFISFLEWLTTIILIYVTLRITGASISVNTFLPIYIEAAVIGIISMIPGGIGTFDLTFMNGLESVGVPIEQTLLVIILYRISYFLVPAVIGVLLFVHDFGSKINEKFNGLPYEIVSKIAYKVVVALVFISGAVITISNIAPQYLFKIKLLKELLGKQVLGLSMGMSIVLGFLIMLISLMMKYRAKSIYKTSMILLLLGIPLSLTNGINPYELAFIIIVSYILYLSRKMFYRDSFVVSCKNTIIDSAILMASFSVYFFILIRFGRYLKYVGIVRKMPYKIAYKFGFIAFVLVTVIYVAIYFFNVRRKIPVKVFDECKEDVERIIEEYKGDSLTHLVFLKDKYIYLNEDKDLFIQYEVYGDKLFVLGNPVGNTENLFREIEKFCEYADNYGYTPVFYQVNDEMISYLHSNGYDFMKIGEEAKVDVKEFKVVGNKMKSLKTSRSKVTKEGYTFHMVEPPFSREFLDSLRNISDEWLDGRKEKGFSVGFFDEDYLNKAPIAVLKDAEGEIKAFANIMYMYDDESFSVDLMRFSKNTPRGVMDFMFISLIEYGKEKGYEIFNMGMAPLANVGLSKYAFWNEKLALQVYENGQAFYSFKGLRRFKEKFSNKWDYKYIAYRRNTSILITVIQAALICSRNRDVNDGIFIRFLKNIK